MKVEQLWFIGYVPYSYRLQFGLKVIALSKQLFPSNYEQMANNLMTVMFIESAATFRADITNSIGATGLIQFMPDTAKKLGTSTEALKKMGALNQLDYVFKYHQSNANKIKTGIDLYTNNFFPAALGKSDNYILETKNLPAWKIAKQNPLWDTNKDLKIYNKELKAAIYTYIKNKIGEAKANAFAGGIKPNENNQNNRNQNIIPQNQDNTGLLAILGIGLLTTAVVLNNRKHE